MAEIVLQPSTQDTCPNEFNKTEINGNATTMRVSGRVDRNRRAYVQFDLSSLAGKTITSVNLLLNAVTVNDVGGYPADITVVRCLDAWDEATMDWAPQPTISGTNLATMGWTVALGWITHGPLNLTEFALMQADNKGMRVWIAAGDSGGANDVDYATSEHGTAALRPKLVVEYTEEGGAEQIVWIM